MNKQKSFKIKLSILAAMLLTMSFVFGLCAFGAMSGAFSYNTNYLDEATAAEDNDAASCSILEAVSALSNGSFDAAAGAGTIESYSDFDYKDPVINSIRGNLWYFDEGYLNIPYARTVIDGWKASGELSTSKAGFKPIVIAIIDTGVDTAHEIFGQNTEFDVFFRDNTNAIVCAKYGYVSETFFDRSSASHGTHVTGVAATLIRALGLSEYIKIMPIRVAPKSDTKDTFQVDNVISALDFAVDNGADIINMSFTADATETAFINKSKPVVTRVAKSALLVAAAGNKYSSSSRNAGYPAAFPEVVGVMGYEPTATGDPKFASSYSNYGDAYDIMAPGGSQSITANKVYSSMKTGNSKDYDYKNGTSMASPMVTVAGALLYVRYNIRESFESAELTQYQVKAMLLNQESVEKISYTGDGSIVGLSFKALVDDNFLDMEDIYYNSPVGINISYNAEAVLKQKITSMTPITFSAEILAAEDTTISPKVYVEWLVNEKVIASGKSFVFNSIDYSSDGAGTFDVYCRTAGAEANVESTSVIVNVAYLEAKPMLITMSASKLSVMSGKTITLSLSGSGMDNTDPLTVVKWYVSTSPLFENDVALVDFKTTEPFYVDSSGSNTLSFTPEKEGVYYVAALYGDKVVKGTVTLDIKINIFTWILPVAISGAVVLVGAILFIVLSVKNKKKTKKDV